MISAAVFLSPYMDEPITALAWGVLVAGVAQLLFQLPFLRQIGLLPKPEVSWKDSGVRRVGKLMLPALFGVSVTQINLLIDTIIASFLVTGSVSWLYYSDRMVEFPLGIFGIALATVILPGLSRSHAEKSAAEFSRTLDWALRWVLLLVPPAMLGLFILAGPILATLFQYQEFTPNDVAMATQSLMAYSVGLAAFVLIKVLASGFFARQDTKSPVRIGVIAMGCNVVLNLILVVPLAHAGLALATSLAACVNATLLFMKLNQQGVLRAEPGWLLYAGRIMVANLVMVVLLVVAVPEMANWIEWDVWNRVGQLLLWVGAGGAAYLGTLYLSGLRPHQLMHSSPNR
jgi:putative peptidoglycan lipid II flippase